MHHGVKVVQSGTQFRFVGSVVSQCVPVLQPPHWPQFLVVICTSQPSVGASLQSSQPSAQSEMAHDPVKHCGDITWGQLAACMLQLLLVAQPLQ